MLLQFLFFTISGCRHRRSRSAFFGGARLEEVFDPNSRERRAKNFFGPFRNFRKTKNRAEISRLYHLRKIFLDGQGLDSNDAGHFERSYFFASRQKLSGLERFSKSS